MAALSFATISLRPPAEFPTGNLNYQKPITFLTQKRQLTASLAANSPDPVPAATPERPKIELEFIGPKPGEDGKYLVDRATELSGEKLLRSIMADNKIELYAAYGKVMNCGGGGSCGTCIVEVLDGKDLLNERTNTELKYLKKKPESWRLACQTIVGNKENSGKIIVDCARHINKYIRHAGLTTFGSDSKVASMEEVTAKELSMSMELIKGCHLLKRS